MLTWVNGRLLGEEQAVVSVFDHGLTVGDGVFETMKVIDGVPFALERHLVRLVRSARAVGLPEPDLDAVRAGCAEVLDAAGSGRQRLRVTYTGGVAPLGSARGDSAPTVIVAAAPAPPPPPSSAIAVVPWARNEQGALAGVKSTSYAENVVALARAVELGADEAVFGDTQGRLSEGTGSNVFVVLDGEVRTPSLDTGCLAGITRELVLEWTHAREAEPALTELERASEVFITSSTRDVLPVHRIIWPDGRRRDLPAENPMTRQIAEEFQQRAAADPEP